MPGKDNDFRVTVTGNSLTVTDTGDTIDEAEPECSGGGTSSVACTFSVPILSVNVAADNLDDSIRVDAPQGIPSVGDNGGSLTLDGGAGGDEVTVVAPPGAPGDATIGGDGAIDPPTHGGDRLVGGGMRDFISGDGGTDVLLGNENDDLLTPGPGDGDRAEGGPGDDGVDHSVDRGTGEVLDGGDGVDVLFSFNQPAALSPGERALTVDLAAGTFVQTAGGDATASTTGFEDLDGRGIAFTVRGTDGPNSLLTGESDDVLDPRGGLDRVEARSGADRVTARDGFADRIECGPGVDTVEADQFDELFDCENVDVAEVLPAGVESGAPVCQVTGVRRRVPRRRFVTRAIRPQVGCDEAVALDVQLTVGVRRRRGELVTVRAGQLVLAERALPLATGARRVRLKVPRRLRPVLGRRFTARVRVVARDVFGNRSAVTRVVRVR